jgi:hypothetical protein
MKHAQELLEEVIETGRRLTAEARVPANGHSC